MVTDGPGRENLTRLLARWSGGDAIAFEQLVDGVYPELHAMAARFMRGGGTSTLHVAAYGVPMIVVYRVSRILWHILGRWVIRTRKIALVNILAGQTELVPEFIPWYGSNQPVVDCAIDMLKHPQKLTDQREKLNALVATLDKRGASMNVAKMAMDMMGVSRG